MSQRATQLQAFVTINLMFIIFVLPVYLGLLLAGPAAEVGRPQVGRQVGRYGVLQHTHIT